MICPSARRHPLGYAHEAFTNQNPLAKLRLPCGDANAFIRTGAIADEETSAGAQR